MASTRATMTIGRGEATPEITIETPTMGKGSARGRDRDRGREVAPMRDYARGISSQPARSLERSRFLVIMLHHHYYRIPF